MIQKSYRKYKEKKIKLELVEGFLSSVNDGKIITKINKNDTEIKKKFNLTNTKKSNNKINNTADSLSIHKVI